ncbi:MAG: DUF3320 domain-containing protein [Clostridia bacterium]|nr:DUF3320 domain-containing protein [Clostridia bacterium]
MNPIENKKIEYWKSQLLDTGKRNKMINYRETSRATLKIIEPGLNELYENYVQNENELTFQYPIDKDSDIRTYSVLKLLDKLSCPIPVLLGDIKVATSFQESKKTLKNLRNKSRLAQEEQGTNILYLSLGFIEWQENHGSHHSWVKSPLILVPVSLTVESLNAPYKLVRYDDDVVVNPTLQHLLSADYGVELPPFDSDKDTIEDYLKSLEDIADEKGWRIIREASIGLLSFLKINMYKDLEHNIENITNNVVLKAMLGDTSEITNIPEELKSYNHDALIPKECFQVLSADSSQQDAIELSKRGVSFVMQGPPGTGKSQTITNIIAEALASDKKVLFVSEKMAALQVVYKRLSDLGLAEFCLALHSHKANKKQILDDIQNTLSLKKTRVKQEAIEELDRLNFERTELNKYATELHEEVAPLNISCYDAYGILDNLKNASDSLFSLENVDAITRETLNEMIYNLENLSNYINNSNFDIENNPWLGVVINSLSLDDKQVIDNNITLSVQYLKALTSNLGDLTTEYNIDTLNTLQSIKGLVDFIKTLLQISVTPEIIFDNDNIKDLEEFTQKAAERICSLIKDREIVDSWFYSDVYNVDLSKIKSEINSKVEQLKEVLDSSITDNVAENIDNYYADISDILNNMTNVVNLANSDMSLLCLNMPLTLTNLSVLHDLIVELKTQPSCQKQWFDAKILGSAIFNISKYKELSFKINSLNNEILSNWEKEIFDIEYTEILNRFKTDYKSIFKIFNSNYRADKKAVIRNCKDPLAKISDQQIVTTLLKIKELNELTTELANNKSAIDEMYGSAFSGTNTDWEAVSLDLSSLQKILALYPDASTQSEFKNILINNEYDKLSRIFATFDELSSERIQSICSTFNRLFLNKLNSNEDLTDVISKIKSALETVGELQSQIKELKGIYKDTDSHVGIFVKLEKAIELRSSEDVLKNEEQLFKSYYADLYNYTSTDWNEIKKHIDNKKEFDRLVSTSNIPKHFLRTIATHSDKRIYITTKTENIEKTLLDVNRLQPFFEKIFGETVSSLSIDTLQEKYSKCSGKVELLEKYLEYKTFRDKCISCGLEEFILLVEKDGIKDVVDSFKKRFYMLWLSKVLDTKPSIANFKGVTHDKTVSDFCMHDEHQLSIARMRIREKLINNLPSKDRLLSAHDEMSILTRELGKKRRIMPIRKLFKSIPNLLMKIKPCFMMSPLSVSYFLEAQTYDFDMVIFDEASQIFPEDAIGAILRSKQVIIAGDTKQLPPTNFFASSANNLDGQFDSSEDEYEEEIFDSILEETASILPNRTLLWHYRSRHEDLIAFSNSHIYKNELITFPGSAISKKDTGVEYYKVADGVYEDRCNISEAKKCVDLIIEHINNYPDLSLGIIAFSEKQQSTIEQVLYEYREQHPQYEWFFDENKDEPFFIKNLENVQGDERDTIIFSICYAKNSRGTMLMNFGPLGKQGGERRLNVAVTRAKTNIKLVGSIEPTDIDLDRAKSDGARLLRSYIEFAMNGPSTLPAKQEEAIENRDDFCDCIYDFLTSNGFKVARNIGCSDYKIDLAVEHPKNNGTFVAGIECDGESYSSARTARERDHLRPQILKNMGWNMYRIWSTAWIKNTNDEQERLLNFINDCLKQNPQQMTLEANETYDVPVETVVEDKSKSFARNNTTNPYGFGYYVEAKWWDAPQNYSSSNEQRVADVINYVLEIEQPIHIDLLYQRLAGLFGREKATSYVREQVDYVLNRTLRNSVKIEDGFASRTDMSEIKVRVSKIITDEARKVEHISLPEIGKAMMIIAEYALGINESDLKVETARIFGFERMGPKVTKAMNDAFVKLLKSGKIKLIDEKVHIVEEL